MRVARLLLLSPANDVGDDGPKLCLTRHGLWGYYGFAYVGQPADGLVLPYADLASSFVPEVRASLPAAS